MNNQKEKRNDTVSNRSSESEFITSKIFKDNSSFTLFNKIYSLIALQYHEQSLHKY